MGKQDLYIKVLEEELEPALGCTEPIAIAYTAAVARQALGVFPEHITAYCSGNIIKNVKSVIVPNTDGARGVEASCLAGAIANAPQCKLQVLEALTDEGRRQLHEKLRQDLCTVALLPSQHSLHLILEMTAQGHTVRAELVDAHTNVVSLERDGEPLYLCQEQPCYAESETDRSFMSIEGIYDFAVTVDLSRVQALLDRQIACNLRIAQEGLTGRYGAAVGATLLEEAPDDIKTVAKAYAAAGSDARMSGCSLPVVINSGSGNQGITVSLPVIKYAQYLGCSQEQLYRALLLSNLVSIHEKSGMGRLSAYCGAVTAACGAGAGITYLCGGDFETISRTITNTLANVSGIICDGAKPSCAAKIASSVGAAILAHTLSMKGRSFHSGDGIVGSDLEDTVSNVTILARDGMRQTDDEILKIMTQPVKKGEAH